MRSCAYLLFILGLTLGSMQSVRAELGVGGNGRGGPFIEVHTNSLNAFDPSLSGVPIVVGGTGYGYISKNVRIGGTGGGGFVWSGSNNTHFAMGYGGIFFEYVFNNWLSARALLGGGGYDVEKVVSQTTVNETIQRLGSGGFVLVYPAISITYPLQNWIGLQASVGYFMPNDNRMQGLTIGAGLTFGK